MYKDVLPKFVFECDKESCVSKHQDCSSDLLSHISTYFNLEMRIAERSLDLYYADSFEQSNQISESITQLKNEMFELICSLPHLLLFVFESSGTQTISYSLSLKLTSNHPVDIAAIYSSAMNRMPYNIQEALDDWFSYSFKMGLSNNQVVDETVYSEIEEVNLEKSLFEFLKNRKHRKLCQFLYYLYKLKAIQ